MRLTRRGWTVLLGGAFVIGIATGPLTYYDYETTNTPYPTTEETLP